LSNAGKNWTGGGFPAVFYCLKDGSPGLKKRSYLKTALCGILISKQDMNGGSSIKGTKPFGLFVKVYRLRREVALQISGAQG